MVQNTGRVKLPFTATVSAGKGDKMSGITVEPANGTLAAGENMTLALKFNLSSFAYGTSSGWVTATLRKSNVEKMKADIVPATEVPPQDAVERLRALAGVAPVRLGAHERSAREQRPEKILESLQQEAGLEAAEPAELEEGIAELEMAVSDPLQRMLVLQMKQMAMLTRQQSQRQPADPLAVALYGGSDGQSTGSGSVKGCAAREAYLKVTQDHGKVAMAVMDHACRELGLDSSQVGPGLMKEYIERKCPLGDNRLTQQAYLWAFAWETGFKMNDVVLMGVATFKKHGKFVAFEDILNESLWLHTIQDIDDFLTKEMFQSLSNTFRQHRCPLFSRMNLDTYVWLDYSSIPQRHRPSQTAAINSLTVYAAKVSAFIVVAPKDLPGVLCDEDTYKKRAWCRAEQLSHLLAQAGDNMFLAKKKRPSQSTPGFLRLNDDAAWLEQSIEVFKGELTCCRRKHVGMDMCDRERLRLRGPETQRSRTLARLRPCRANAGLVGPALQDRTQPS
eukprot:g29839.t1